MPLIVPGIASKNVGSGGGGSQTEQWTNLLLGKKIGDKSDETNFAKKELPSNHRVVKEGGMMTMDFQPDRLNVHVGDDGVVKKVTHG